MSNEEPPIAWSFKRFHAERTLKTHRILVTLFHGGWAMDGAMIADALAGEDLSFVLESLRYLQSRNLVSFRGINGQKYFTLTELGMHVARLITSHAPEDVEYLSLTALIVIVSLPNHRPYQSVRLPKKADVFGEPRT